MTTACAATLLLAACGDDAPPVESVQAARLACGLDGDLLVTTVGIFVDDGGGPELDLMRDGCPDKLRAALEELGRAAGCCPSLIAA